MNWLITGGCGFIGTNLIDRIRGEDKGAYIRVVDNLQSGRRDMLRSVCDFTEPAGIVVKPGRVHFFPYNIKNEVFALKVCRDIDVIIHLAANTGVPVSVEFPRDDCMTNVVGTLNYLEAARHNNVKTFILASTSAASGGYDPPFHEKLFPRPIAPYGASKGAGEAYCHVYNATYGVSTVAMRFSNVYGPNSTNKLAQLIPNFVMGALNGETVKIFGDGTQTRDYCYVDDLMDAIMLSVKRIDDIGGNVIQIATNQETSVQQVMNIIMSKLLEYDIGMQIEYVDERSGDLQRNYSDVSKAARLLGWSYKTDIKEGIEKTIEWFVKEL